MSSGAPGILRLNDYVGRVLGPDKQLGIVGDASHTYGYHLGPDRAPSWDSSISELTRDRTGANRYPYYASAIDIGMGWGQSRQWLAWFIDRLRKGAYPDVREVIGSLDGRNALYFDGTDGFDAYGYSGGGHVSHTHISFYRDSAERDQTPVLRDFLEGITSEEQDDDMGNLLPIYLPTEFGGLADGTLPADLEKYGITIGFEPVGESAVNKYTQASLSLGVDRGQVKFRIARHIRNQKSWGYLNNDGFHGIWKHTETPRLQLWLPKGTDAISIFRIPLDKNDTTSKNRSVNGCIEFS